MSPLKHVGMFFGNYNSKKLTNKHTQHFLGNLCNLGRFRPQKVFSDDTNSRTYPISNFPLGNFSTEEADFSKKDFKVCSFVCKMDQQNRPA